MRLPDLPSSHLQWRRSRDSVAPPALPTSFVAASTSTLGIRGLGAEEIARAQPNLSAVSAMVMAGPRVYAAMAEDDPPVRITRIDLHPQVVLADTERPRPDAGRLTHLTEVAHRECYIANSLRTEVAVHPTFRWTEVAGT